MSSASRAPPSIHPKTSVHDLIRMKLPTFQSALITEHEKNWFSGSLQTYQARTSNMSMTGQFLQRHAEALRARLEEVRGTRGIQDPFRDWWNRGWAHGYVQRGDELLDAGDVRRVQVHSWRRVVCFNAAGDLLRVHDIGFSIGEADGGTRVGFLAFGETGSVSASGRSSLVFCL